jgi:hypothetical protein
MSAAAAGCDPAGVARRVPQLLPHLLIAAALLVGLALWAHADGQVTMDEGVAVVQARAVHHGSWAVADPLAGVDPTGEAFPLRATTPIPGGYAPFARHPLYPALLSVADRAAGTTGMVGLSILGTLGAAAAAAALARRLDPRLPVPTLYVTALASPLLFDSTLVLAHTLGAAAAGAAAVGLVRHHESAHSASPWLAAVAAATAATVLLRGEGLLLALAATAVFAVLAAARRSRPWALVAATLAGATGLAIVVDQWWEGRIVGHGIALPGPPSEAVSWLHARIDALSTTTLRADYGGGRTPALLVAGAALLLVAAVALRRGTGGGRIAVPAAVAGAALVAVWSTATSPSPVPGLLLAFPALWVGLVAGRWADVPLARGLVLVAGLFAVAVAATQYRQGGGYEWGARYVALALPLVVPVAVLGLLRAAQAAGERGAGRALGVALAVVTVALAGVGVAARRDAGTSADRLGRAIVATAPASHLGAEDEDGRPIVLSSEFAVPQATTAVFDDARWLQLYDAEIRGEAAGYVRRLLTTGVDRFTFVTLHPDRASELLAGTIETSRRQVGAWTLIVVRSGSA